MELRVPVVNRVRGELRAELEHRGFQPGPYEAGAAQKLLHPAVGFYVGRLEEKIRELAVFDTTGELMARYELFLRESGHVANGPHRRELNVIAVASRFVVEVAAARPPDGDRRPTNEIYEELVATAAEVVNHGIYSDLLHTGVVPVSVWIDEHGYLSNMPEQERDLRLLAFVQQWSDAGQSHVLARWQERPLPDEVMLAEFGITYDDLFVVYDSVRQAPGAFLRTTPAQTLRTEIAEQLGAEQADAFITHFTVGPRAQIAPPPAPYELSDVFPWLFARRLSYLHRPVVRTTDRDGVEWFAWTERHIDGAMLHFFASVRDGRYKALSAQLEDWATETRQVFASMLNDEVAEELRRRERFVWDRVKNIGGRRIVGADGADLGDVDVLAVDREAAIVYPLEIKDLAVGFTPRAFASSVERITEAITKHRRRVAWVQENLAHVVERQPKATRDASGR
jgi:hypothetical protein